MVKVKTTRNETCHVTCPWHRAPLRTQRCSQLRLPRRHSLDLITTHIRQTQIKGPSTQQLTGAYQRHAGHRNSRSQRSPQGPRKTPEHSTGISKQKGHWQENPSDLNTACSLAGRNSPASVSWFSLTCPAQEGVRMRETEAGAHGNVLYRWEAFL